VTIIICPLCIKNLYISKAPISGDRDNYTIETTAMYKGIIYLSRYTLPEITPITIYHKNHIPKWTPMGFAVQLLHNNL